MTYDEFLRLFHSMTALDADVGFCQSQNTFPPDDVTGQFWARAEVRAIFGAIEAKIWFCQLAVFPFLRKHCHDPVAINQHNLKIKLIADRATLDRIEDLMIGTTQHWWEPDDSNGKAKFKPRKLRFAQLYLGVCRTMKMFSGVPESELERQMSVCKQGMPEAVKVRDRLMHPKMPHDIIVKPTELAVCRQFYATARYHLASDPDNAEPSE